MSRRTTAWLAWALGVLSLALAGTSLAFHLVHPESEARAFPYWAGNAQAGAAFGLLGGLVAARRPRHPVGWLLLALSGSSAASALAGRYGPHAYWASFGADPRGLWAAWLASWVWIAGVPAIVLLLLLFPDGRLLSSRWRPLVWLIGALAALDMVRTALGPGALYWTSMPNPAGMTWAGTLAHLRVPLAALEFAVALAATQSLVLRYRRTAGIERQQIKWLAFALGFCVPLYAATAALDFALGQRLLFPLVGSVVGPLFAGSIAVAILRYRLYDIDVVINRTLIYGTLTTGLGLTYWAGVVLLQAELQPLTQGSELAVAGSTLAVVAIFRPLRTRIQQVVDRRFYRRKYDAARTLEAFNARLQQEVDLDTLSDELVAVVRETMQPAYASLWLRLPGGAVPDGEATRRTERFAGRPPRARNAVRNDFGTHG